MSTKACLGFFLFCLDIQLFAKITYYLQLLFTKKNFLSIYAAITHSVSGSHLYLLCIANDEKKHYYCVYYDSFVH